MCHCTLGNWQCQGAPNHYTNVTTRNTIYRFTELHNLTQHTQITQIKSLQLCLHLYTTHYINSQLVNYTKWQSSVCRCAMLCYHNIDHLWHGKIYTNTITQKRIPCAGAQCCAVTTLTTSDTEKFKDVTQYSEWLTVTQKIHFCVPVIVKFSHYRYRLPLYRVIPGTRAAWEAPRAREPTYQ